MASIYITDKDEVRELTCKENGIDFMSDILGGFDENGKYGTTRWDAEWQMCEEDYQWWSEWAHREERILAKADELGEEAIEEVTRLGVLYGSDLDALHDAQERYLGL